MSGKHDMVRRPPLTEKLRSKAKASFSAVAYRSDRGRALLQLLPSAGETDELYLHRINSMEHDERKPDVTFIPRLYLVTSKKHQGRDAAQENKTSILRSLDQLADEWVTLGEKFLAAAEDADPERLLTLAAEGAPINYQDPRNGAAALHYIAAQAARPALRILLKIGGCDFLLRDEKGRLASDLAGVYGHDLVMERLLLNKEIRQAREAGVPMEQLYRRDPTSGFHAGARTLITR